MKNDNEFLGPLLPPEDRTTEQLLKACLYLLYACALFMASMVIYIFI